APPPPSVEEFTPHSGAPPPPPGLQGFHPTPPAPPIGPGAARSPPWLDKKARAASGGTARATTSRRLGNGLSIAQTEPRHPTCHRDRLRSPTSSSTASTVPPGRSCPLIADHFSRPWPPS